MASPEANDAALAASESLGSVVEDKSGTLRGWKKKSFSTKSGARKKQDVSYIAPNGAEIKSRRHLLRYLKAHPVDLKAGDFCWSSVEAPRRSARLNRKLGRQIRFEELEVVPRKRGKRNNNSEARSGRVRKPEVGNSRAQDDLMLLVKEELVMETEMQEASKALPCNLRSSHAKGEELVQVVQTINPLGSPDNSQPDNQILVVKSVQGFPEEMSTGVIKVEAASVNEAIVLGVHTSLSIAPVSSKPPPAAEGIDASDIPMEGTQPSEALKTEFEVVEVESDDAKVALRQNDTIVVTVVADMDGGESPKIEQDKTDVADIEDVAIAIVGYATVDSITETILLEEPIEEKSEGKNKMRSPEGENVVADEEFLKEEIVEYATEECVDEETVEKVNEMDTDKTTIVVQGKEDVIHTKAVVDLPQPQGIHALVDDTVTFGGQAKTQPDNELVPQVSLEVSERLL